MSALETVFRVMVVVGAFLPHGHAIDAAHARANVYFRLAMVRIGVTGLAVVFILKRRLPPEPGAVRITYRATQASAWRGEIYNATHRWQTVLNLAAAPLIWFFLSVSADHPSPADALARLALILLGWFALLGLVLWLTIRRRYPLFDSIRVCTTTLTVAGYEDVTPDKVYSVPWREVTAIREQDGDIFFWRGGAQGNIINREAFQDRRQAQEFYAAALALWNGKAADWPYAPASVPADDDRAWPPPPQVRLAAAPLDSCPPFGL